MSLWSGATVLVTGGTGTFGTTFTELLLRTEQPSSVRILARSEHRLEAFRERFRDGRIRICKGDIRDERRLLEVMDGVHIVVHAAALKRVEGTQDAEEMVKTNVHGSMNVIAAAIERRVERVMAISSDKACQAITLYGATKLTMEQLFMSAHGRSRTAFAVCRYGNVAGSTGSVAPYWRKLAAQGQALPVTDVRCTRFWVSIADAVRWVKRRIELMEPGHIYVPVLPSIRLPDLASTISSATWIVGMRGLEKLHEQMIGFDESRTARFGRDDSGIDHWVLGGEPTGAPEFTYSSETNDHWLSEDEIRQQVP